LGKAPAHPELDAIIVAFCRRLRGELSPQGELRQTEAGIGDEVLLPHAGDDDPGVLDGAHQLLVHVADGQRGLLVQLVLDPERPLPRLHGLEIGVDQVVVGIIPRSKVSLRRKGSFKKLKLPYHFRRRL
jgi:hypothetical protein